MADSMDERLRNVEQTLARIEITLEHFLRIELRVDELRQDLLKQKDRHESLAFTVHQNQLIVNALKWVAAAVIPIVLSVLGTVFVSWLRMGNGV